MQPENSQVHRSSRVTQGATKWWIRCPPHTGSLFNLSAQQQQNQSHRENPEGNVIHTGECHIWPSNHDRNKPVTKATHQSRHYNKELHQQSVCSNLYVVKLSVSCQNTRTSVPQLHSNQQTHGSCNNTRPPCKYQVHHSNVFSVGATKPSNKQCIKFIRRIFH